MVPMYIIPPLLLAFTVAPRNWVPAVVISKNATPVVWVLGKVQGDGPKVVARV